MDSSPTETVAEPPPSIPPPPGVIMRQWAERQLTCAGCDVESTGLDSIVGLHNPWGCEPMCQEWGYHAAVAGYVDPQPVGELCPTYKEAKTQFLVSYMFPVFSCFSSLSCFSSPLLPWRQQMFKHVVFRFRKLP